MSAQIQDNMTAMVKARIDELESKKAALIEETFSVDNSLNALKAQLAVLEGKEEG